MATELITKQVIVLRKDLNMRKGKMIAQGAHASMKVLLDEMINQDNQRVLKLDDKNLASWLNGKFTKIAVSVNSEAELLALCEQAKSLGIRHALIQDSGLTEFAGIPTYTAAAFGPDLVQRLDPLTGKLPLL